MSYIQELRSLVGHRPLIMAGAAVLIVDDRDRLLLQLRKDNHLWGLIGGSMEIGESLEETAKREVREETGLILDELKWFGLFSGREQIYQYPNGDIVANVTAVYTSRYFRGEIKTHQEEVERVQFFEIHKLPKQINPSDKTVLEKYLCDRKRALV
jgi:8-oxo-dGTP pyrophosphatase MutT (NUDIX family)